MGRSRTWSMDLLRLDNFTIDLVGDAAAAAGHGFAVFLRQQGSEDFFTVSAAAERILGNSLEHAVDELGHEIGFEVLRDLSRRGVVGGFLLCRIDRADRRQSGKRVLEIEHRHHITSISAWSAPEALIA